MVIICIQEANQTRGRITLKIKISHNLKVGSNQKREEANNVGNIRKKTIIG